MTRKAYSFVRTFAAEPARDLCVDRHYLLCVSAGALRLEAQGRAWLLPPAWAALIEAGRLIRVSLPHPVTTASVPFDTAFTPAPPAPLTVFDLSPLARALVAPGVPDQVRPGQAIPLVPSSRQAREYALVS